MTSPRRPRYALGAALLVASFVLLHALGMREHVSVLSGAQPINAWVGVGGTLYVVAWLAAVVAAPIFAIAEVVRVALVAFGRVTKR